MNHKPGYYWFLHEESSGEQAIIKVEENNDGELVILETEFHNQPRISYEKYKHRILDLITDFSTPGMKAYIKTRPHKYPS